MEDTDKERSTKEFEKDIIDGLVKLGLAGDEGIHLENTIENIDPKSPQSLKNPKNLNYRQSERTEIYTKYLQQLLNEDKAYYCFCSKERLNEVREEQKKNKQATRYDGKCSEISPEEAKKRVEGGEKAVIRLRVPKNQEIIFKDLVRGEVKINSKELDDFVIARSINDPLYHLTVVADDHDMEISHIIRGEDHISNTPKQILLFEAFGWEIPEFAHLPLILNEDKTKLSKRKNKVSIDDFLAEGYLPEALINFLALLGWNTPDEQEIFSMEELINKFTLEAVHKGGAVFDVKKLDWINGEYIKKEIKGDIDAFYEKVKPFFISNRNQSEPQSDINLIKKILQDPDFEGRFKKLSEIPEELEIFFTELKDYPFELICREKFKITPEILKNVFTKAKEILENMEWERGDNTKSEEISNELIKIVSELDLKNGQVLWPIRAALSGTERSPNFATLAVYLGKEETLKRIEFALKKIKPS